MSGEVKSEFISVKPKIWAISYRLNGRVRQHITGAIKKPSLDDVISYLKEGDESIKHGDVSIESSDEIIRQ